MRKSKNWVKTQQARTGAFFTESLETWLRKQLEEPDYANDLRESLLKNYQRDNYFKYINRAHTRLDSGWQQHFHGSHSCSSGSCTIYSALVNQRTDLSYTAVHIAVKQKDLELLNFLIAKGADLNRQDIEGNTPLDLALKARDVNTAKYLIKKSAKSNTKEKAFKFFLEDLKKSLKAEETAEKESFKKEETAEKTEKRLDVNILLGNIYFLNFRIKTLNAVLEQGEKIDPTLVSAIKELNKKLNKKSDNSISISIFHSLVKESFALEPIKLIRKQATKLDKQDLKDLPSEIAALTKRLEQTSENLLAKQEKKRAEELKKFKEEENAAQQQTKTSEPTPTEIPVDQDNEIALTQFS